MPLCTDRTEIARIASHGSHGDCTKLSLCPGAIWVVLCQTCRRIDAREGGPVHCPVWIGDVQGLRNVMFSRRESACSEVNGTASGIWHFSSTCQV